ncbi:MAG: PHP domain-containing protein [Candidatus Hydrogenedentes bacterium]|nr:PHP domain-containing protein [Candidatus Hydrogenedentota bacterium]
MSLRLETPYLNAAMPWLRGSLHTHTANSDGRQSPQKLVDAYAARNHDFLMMSDHDTLTPPDSVLPRGMVLIPGVEVTANGPHLLHVNAQSPVEPHEDRQAVLNAIREQGGFAILNHPNWGQDFNHYPQSLLESLQGYAGVEIYNGVRRRDEGSPLAVDRWDQLLAKGRRVWGYANDDCHGEGDEQVAWMMVQAEHRQRSAIVDALRRGRFYCTTGVLLYTIAVDGADITVEAESAEKIVVFGDYGRRLAEAEGGAMTYTANPEAGCTYVRFEAYGYGESCAWTQPFFLMGA